MNWVGNEITPSFKFLSLLKTREQISVSAYFVALGRLRANLLTPFASDEPYRQGLTDQLRFLAEGSVNQWALGLSSAEDIKAESYRALERHLLLIRSPNLTVHQVYVSSIVPLSPPQQKPVTPVPEKHWVVLVKERLDDKTTGLEMLQAYREHILEHHPGIWTDQELGSVLRADVEHITNSIKANRKPR
jgi:hypothetical protein